MANDHKKRDLKKPPPMTPPTFEYSVAPRPSIDAQCDSDTKFNTQNSKLNNTNSIQKLLSTDKGKIKIEENLSQEEVLDILNSKLAARPLSSRLSKYATLPQIGTSARANLNSRASSRMSAFEFDNVDFESEQRVLIGLRLPNGSKKQKIFYLHDSLQQVLNYAMDEMRMSEDFKEASANSFALLQMPNTVYDDLTQSLDFYRIENRSMFFVIDKKLLSLN